MTNKESDTEGVPEDWHPADIKAALEKRGWSLSKLSRAHGYKRGSAAKALYHPWPRMERIIAKVLDLEPWQIWPSRYNDSGSSNRGPGGRPPYIHSATIDGSKG